MGMCDGVSFPSMHQIYSEWTPIPERSRIVMFVFCGSYVGIVLAMSVCGVLAEAYGWESVFYITGIFGYIWTILWFLIVKRSPEQDRFITEEEKDYIKNNLGIKDNDENLNVPWMSIFKSKPFWAIIVSQFADNWGLYTFLTQLPLFLKGKLIFTLIKSLQSNI
jgi:ACS family sodium-dependent inorganic phosphate cotransporter